MSNQKESMMISTAAPKVVGPADGGKGFLGSIGVRFMIDGAEADQRLSLVEHPMSPRALAAPLHRHNREDEYSYVLEGRVGALLGDDVLVGSPGDLIFKPRNQWHTFWNAGAQGGALRLGGPRGSLTYTPPSEWPSFWTAGREPASIREIISPAGFEGF